jgi:hypothetical protein
LLDWPVTIGQRAAIIRGMMPKPDLLGVDLPSAEHLRDDRNDDGNEHGSQR